MTHTYHAAREAKMFTSTLRFCLGPQPRFCLVANSSGTVRPQLFTTPLEEMSAISCKLTPLLLAVLMVFESFK
jgi:hypothetical protein